MRHAVLLGLVPLSCIGCTSAITGMSSDERTAFENVISEKFGAGYMSSKSPRSLWIYHNSSAQGSACRDYLQELGKPVCWGMCPMQDMQYVDGSTSLSGFERVGNQATDLGVQADVIKANYSGRYRTQCESMAQSRPYRASFIPVEVCIEGFASLYKSATMRDYDLASITIDRSNLCPDYKARASSRPQ